MNSNADSHSVNRNMASFEQTRDFRSGAQDAKRSRSQKAKWALGSRPSAGVRLNWARDEYLTGNEGQHAKFRPNKILFHDHYNPHNVNKARIGEDLPYQHQKHKADVIAELQDPNNTSRSTNDLLPLPRTTSSLQRDQADKILYSYDRADTPGKPQSLDVFIKTNPKETEKFVEKEYEILDENGQALKGKKARANLRRKSPKQEPAAGPSSSLVVEDDGFELI